MRPPRASVPGWRRGRTHGPSKTASQAPPRPRVLTAAPTSGAPQKSLRGGNAAGLEPQRDPQRTADRLVRRLHHVLRVAAARLDVDRQPAGLREAAEDVGREA